MNPLPVPHIYQELNYYCGPAVAAMILTYHQAAPPAGTSRQLLDQLWADISQQPPPAGAMAGAGVTQCDGYNGEPQVFFCCAGGGCRGWCSPVAALLSVLNEYLPASKTMRVMLDPGVAFRPRRAIAALIASINNGHPAASLSGNGGGHWLVVRGHHVLHGDQYFFVSDPQDPFGDPQHSVVWDDTLSFVSCGPEEQNNKTVVLVNDHK